MLLKASIVQFAWIFREILYIALEPSSRSDFRLRSRESHKARLPARARQEIIVSRENFLNIFKKFEKVQTNPRASNYPKASMAFYGIFFVYDRKKGSLCQNFSPKGEKTIWKREKNRNSNLENILEENFSCKSVFMRISQVWTFACPHNEVWIYSAKPEWQDLLTCQSIKINCAPITSTFYDHENAKRSNFS